MFKINLERLRLFNQLKKLKNRLQFNKKRLIRVKNLYKIRKKYLKQTLKIAVQVKIKTKATVMSAVRTTIHIRDYKFAKFSQNKLQ